MKNTVVVARNYLVYQQWRAEQEQPVPRTIYASEPRHLYGLGTGWRVVVLGTVAPEMLNEIEKMKLHGAVVEVIA